MSAYEYLIAAFAAACICLTCFSLAGALKRNGTHKNGFRLELLGAVSMFTSLFFFLASLATWTAGI